MNAKIDVHSHEVDKKLSQVPDWKVPESTKKEIKEFVDKARLKVKEIKLMKLLKKRLNKEL